MVKRWGLDLERCVGQGYDGASNMASEAVGAAKVFQEEAGNADFHHCIMHSLNLSASNTITVAGISHAQDVVKETYNVFR